MRTHTFLSAVAAAGVLTVMLSCSPVHAQLVFQAAGPNAASIQGTVDAFRAALGEPNNGNALGPLASGRREINWDGGEQRPGHGHDDAPATPFVVFQNIRGATFTTPGTGLSQGPPSGGGDGGFATLFNNPTYGDIFTFFSPRACSARSAATSPTARSPCPAPMGVVPATVKGFGAVFTDVDKPDGAVKPTARRSSISTPTAVGSSREWSRPHRATRACPSSASCSTRRSSRGCGSRPATPSPGRMTMPSKTSS